MTDLTNLGEVGVCLPAQTPSTAPLHSQGQIFQTKKINDTYQKSYLSISLWTRSQEMSSAYVLQIPTPAATNSTSESATRDLYQNDRTTKKKV